MAWAQINATSGLITGLCANAPPTDGAGNADPSFTLVSDDDPRIAAFYTQLAEHPTAIPLAAFVARFTSAEQAAIVVNPQGLQLWLTLLGYGPTIDLTATLLATSMQVLVTLDLITQARATALLTP